MQPSAQSANMEQLRFFFPPLLQRWYTSILVQCWSELSRIFTETLFLSLPRHIHFFVLMSWEQVEFLFFIFVLGLFLSAHEHNLDMRSVRLCCTVEVVGTDLTGWRVFFWSHGVCFFLPRALRLRCKWSGFDKFKRGWRTSIYCTVFGRKCTNK